VAWIAIIAEALAAVGTFLLAFFTWRLARSAKLDVEAQWRPLLVPGHWQDAGVALLASDWAWAYLSDLGEFHFAFENVGKGAALDVRGRVADQSSGNATLFYDCEALSLPIVDVGYSANFHGPGSLTENHVRVVVEYADLAGNTHSTEAIYLRINDNLNWRVESTDPRPPRYMQQAEYAAKIRLRRVGRPFRAAWSRLRGNRASRRIA
jgi:hypothetical protein